MENILSFLQKLLFPWRCLGCGEFDAIICPRCRQELKFLELRRWQSVRLGESLNMYSFFEYQEPSGLARRLIKLLKYQSMASVLKCLSGILLSERKMFRKDWGFAKKIYYIPGPLHRRRYCERGFNQSVLLAQIFQKIWPGEIVEDLFIRNEYTIAQASLNRESRINNMQGKFILKTEILEKLDQNAQFILVDDVITTGSTMFALSELLRHAGVNDYLAMSLARD
jgi:ComF family protein